MVSGLKGRMIQDVAVEVVRTGYLEWSNEKEGNEE